MSTPELDKSKAEAFAGRMIEMINSACITLMISIGHQTGLFDVMSGLPPSTSDEIARAAKLNERYVREWLGAMVTGRVIEYDPGTLRFRLPAEHAAAITRVAGPDNLAAFAPYVPLVASVEQDVLECFQKGGGVPYSRYDRFQKLMAEESSRYLDAGLFDKLLPLAPGLVERLEAGIDVADIGCGCGHAINLMARAFPRSRFIGFDLSEEGIGAARAEAEQMSLRNARFEVRDASSIDAVPRYDMITAFDSIHDQAHPSQVLKLIAESLRRDGIFLMQDIAASSSLQENMDRLFAPALYTMSTLHCMTVSLAYGGEGLGNMWGEQKARQKLDEAGFKNVEVKEIPGDPLNCLYIATK